jgi:tetratricopeptide (TPR) repeat protein
MFGKYQLNSRTRSYILVFILGQCLSFSQNIDMKDDKCRSGVEHISDHQYQKAIQKLDSDNCLNSKRSTYYRAKLAFAYKKTGNYNTAKSNYKKLLAVDSDNTKALFHLAHIYRKENNDENAVRYYKKLVETDSTNSYYHKILGDHYWGQKNIKGAAESYLKAHQLNDENIDVIYKLSKLFFKIELYQRSEELVEEGLRINPENIKLLKQKANLAYTQKSYGAVIEIVNNVDSIVAKPSNYLLKLKAISLYHTNRYKSAINLFSELVNKYKKTEILHYYLGMSYKKMNDLDKSQYHLEKAIDAGMSNNLASYFTNLGIVFEEQGNSKEAIKAYKLAYEESKDKAILYRLAKNYDAYYADKKVALKYYQKYLEESDSTDLDHSEYAKKRVSSIKKEIHFDIDTLN